MNILVVSTTAIGDTVMATPFIRAIRQHYPQACLSVMAHVRRIELLYRNPHIDEWIVYPGKGKGLLRLLWQLRKGKFDLAIVLHANDPDIVPLVRWTGAPVRLGWGESRWSRFFTHTIYRTHPPEHFLAHKKRLLESVGIPVSDLHTELFLTPDDEVAYQMRLLPWLERNRFEGYVVMHPFGTNLQKWWPVERFLLLSRHLRRMRGWGTVFVGDSSSLKGLSTHPDFCLDESWVAEGFTIRESSVVIQHARAMMTTDSGPMHLALALRRPTLALFGPTSPSIHGPCFDLELHHILHRHPLTDLKVEEVISTAENWLNSTAVQKKHSASNGMS